MEDEIISANFEPTNTDNALAKGMLICQFCDYTAKTEFGLKAHKLKHKEVVSCKCGDCGKGFISITSMLKHAVQEHGGLKCPQNCDKRFHSRTRYSMHIKTQHEGLKYECKLCGKEFLSSDGLKAHRNIHMGVKPYQCDQCGSAFFDSRKLGLHMKKHTKQQKTQVPKKEDLYDTMRAPAICHTCGREFNSRDTMMKHIKKSHTEEPEVDPAILKDHLKDRVLRYAARNSADQAATKFGTKIETVKKWITAATSQFICEICSKVFNTKWHMERHQKDIHLVDKDLTGDGEGKEEKVMVVPTVDEMFLKTSKTNDRSMCIELVDKEKVNKLSIQKEIFEKEDEVMKEEASSGSDYEDYNDFAVNNDDDNDKEPLETSEQHESVRTPEIESKETIPTLSTKLVFQSPEGFTCDLCDKESPTIEKARSHMKQKHEGAVFVCPNCNIRSKTRYDLKKHIRQIHYGV